MNRIKPNQTQLEPTQNRIGRTPDGFEGAKRATLADGRNPKRGRDGARRAAVRLARREPACRPARRGNLLDMAKKKTTIAREDRKSRMGRVPESRLIGIGLPRLFRRDLMSLTFRCCCSCVLLVLIARPLAVLAAPFVNLNFEQATFVPLLEGRAFHCLLALAFPGWTNLGSTTPCCRSIHHNYNGGGIGGKLDVTLHDIPNPC